MQPISNDPPGPSDESESETAAAPDPAAGADLAGLATDIGTAITRFRRALQRSARQRIGAELSPAEVELLSVIADSPGLPVHEAAKQLGAAPNTVSTLIRRLTLQGFVLRETVHGDRRVTSLRLTESAATYVQDWRRDRYGLLAEVLGNIDDDDRARLLSATSVLDALSEALYQPRQR
ncbi:MAG: MarR family transcriptional regulator [Acidimicrobiales bacterium]|nr:MarR family transcriptional regulator [Acidimicrobiales bacterium]